MINIVKLRGLALVVIDGLVNTLVSLQRVNASAYFTIIVTDQAELHATNIMRLLLLRCRFLLVQLLRLLFLLFLLWCSLFLNLVAHAAPPVGLKNQPLLQLLVLLALLALRVQRAPCSRGERHFSEYLVVVFLREHLLNSGLEILKSQLQLVFLHVEGPCCHLYLFYLLSQAGLDPLSALVNVLPQPQQVLSHVIDELLHLVSEFVESFFGHLLRIIQHLADLDLLHL